MKSQVLSLAWFTSYSQGREQVCIEIAIQRTKSVSCLKVIIDKRPEPESYYRQKLIMKGAY